MPVKSHDFNFFLDRIVNMGITLALIIFAILLTSSSIGYQHTTISDHARSEFPSANFYKLKNFIQESATSLQFLKRNNSEC